MSRLARNVILLCLLFLSDVLNGHDHANYEITHTTGMGRHNSGTTSGAYLFVLIGTEGETEEHDCSADRSQGVTDSCSFQDSTNIGKLQAMRIENTSGNTWVFVSMSVKVDGVLRGTWEGTSTVDDYLSATIDLTYIDSCEGLPIRWTEMTTETQFPVPSGSEVSLKCSAGYTLTGDTTVTCKKGRTFLLDNAPVCQLNTCSGLPPEFASLATDKNFPVNYNTAVTVSCRGQKVLTGDDVITCIGDKTFRFQKIPKCCKLRWDFQLEEQSLPPCTGCNDSDKCKVNLTDNLSEIGLFADSGNFDAAAEGLDGLIESGVKLSPLNLKILGKTLQSIRNSSRNHRTPYSSEMSSSIFGTLDMMKNENADADVFEEKEKSQIIEMIEDITAELPEGSNLVKPSILAQSIRFTDEEEVELTLPETVPEQDRPIKLNFGTYRGERTNIAVLENSYKNMLPSPSDGISTIESPIISVTFMESSGATESNTSFSLIFKQKEHSEYPGFTLERKCVYLNTTTNTWLSNGCITQLNTDNTCTCTCSHTTSFAVLLSPTPVTDHEGQETASYVMFVINTSFLTLTFSLIAPFRKLRKNKSVMIQLCLVLTLILGNITFVVLSASTTVAVDDEGTPLLSLNAGCVTGVIISQYFFLSAFFWMGCIAWTFFNKIVRAVKTYGKTNKNYVRNCALLSWICPVIFPISSLLFSLIPNKGSDYSMPYVGANIENGVTHCWVEDPWRYIGFLVPAYLILLFNCVCFGMVARVIVKSVKVESEIQGLYKTAKAMMVAAVSIGLPWLVAGLAVGPIAGFMQYLFIVTTGIQGPLLFISLVLLQEDTRNNTRRLIRRYLGRSIVSSQDTAQSERATSTSHTTQ